MSARMATTFLLLWCGFLFFYGLDTSPLYRTEGLRARIAAEALEGHWLTPTLYDEPFLTKPPGMYASIAAVSLPVGEVTPLTARLPSAIAATIAVLFFYWTFRRLFDPTLALVAGLFLPVSMLWLDKAPSAEIDAVQLMWVIVSLLAFLRAVEVEESGERALGWWLIAMTCVAGGFLTKWTAPAFFYLTVIPLLLWRRRLGLLFGSGHLLGVGMALMLCVGWASAVAVQTGGWSTLVETVRAEAMQRIDPHHGGRAYPWRAVLIFPFEVLGACLPWALLMLPSFHPRFWSRLTPEQSRLAQLFHCWAWPNLLLWSVMSEHAVRYALPMTPAITGLGLMVCYVVGNPMAVWRWRIIYLTLVLWAVVKVVHVEVVGPARTLTRQAPETAESINRLVPDGEMLYLFRLKDEGILFYTGRSVRKLGDLADLPSDTRPNYLLLMREEWEQWAGTGQMKPIRWFVDQQGDRFLLATME